MSGTNLILRLQHVVDHSPQDSDINVTIARFLLSNLRSKDLGITEISDGCFTSKSTISRFAQNIGYDSFNELKNALQESFIDLQEIKLDVQATKKLNLYDEKDFNTHEFELLIEDLKVYQNEMDVSQIDHLCELIHQYPKVSLFAYAASIPGGIAKIIQYQLFAIGKYADYYPVPLDQVELAKKLNKNCLAIFISLEGSYLSGRDLTLRVTESEAHTVLITQNPTSKLSSYFKEIITLGSHSREKSGKYKFLFFTEALMHRYYVKYL